MQEKWSLKQKLERKSGFAEKKEQMKPQLGQAVGDDEAPCSPWAPLLAVAAPSEWCTGFSRDVSL